MRVRLLPLPILPKPEADAVKPSRRDADPSVIAQKHPVRPDINAPSWTQMALSGSAALLGQPAENPKICHLSRRHAQQIVWSIAAFSDRSVYIFENLQII
jgi:hypothetical protein